MKKISKKTVLVFLIILLPFAVFPNGVSFIPVSLESSFSGNFHNIFTLGGIGFEFGKFYGDISIVQFYHYEDAIILEDIGGSIPVIGCYTGGSCFFPVNFGFRPLNRISINMNIGFKTTSSGIETDSYIYQLYENGQLYPYRKYIIPIKYSIDLGIRYQLLKNDHFSLEWSSGIKTYGFPSLGNYPTEKLGDWETIAEIISNSRGIEVGTHKNNIYFPYTGIKITGPSYGKDSKFPSRVIAYTIISCLHSLATLDLGYSQNSVSGNIKYITADCALGIATGALEQFLHDAWVKEYDSDRSKSVKNSLIGLVGGLIWEAGTTTAWATNIAEGGSFGGGGSDYIGRDMLFFGSLQAGLILRIGLSIRLDK
jgi:hypothetical protein